MRARFRGIISMPLLRGLREFIHVQSLNYKVLLIRGVVDQFLTQLVDNFSNLFIVELGATPFQLSAVRALGSAVNTVISVPAGWLSDMYSIKKIMIIGMLVQVLSVALYAFAGNWIWIIAAIVSATITMSLVFRTRNIFIANSLTDSNRAIGYGMRTTVIQIFSIFAPSIGGILVYLFGGISVKGIRPLFFIQLIGYSLISIYVALKLEDIKPETRIEARKFIRDYREMFRAGTNLRRFAFVQALGAITWGMSLPFPFVYAVEFKGANSLIIGYMGTCAVIFSMLLSIPLGSLADRRGRKFAIFITRPFFWLSILLLVLAPKGVSWILLVAWCMRGILMSSFGPWMTMRMEMVPREYRGRWEGFIGLFQNMIRVPAMILGGYLYESVNPVLVFIIPLLVDALVRMPVLASVPDTLKQRK